MARRPNSGAVDEIGSARGGGGAAATAKRGDKIAAPTKKKRSAAFYSMVFFISILTCFLFYETVLLLSVGMLPTGVAYLIDTHPRRYATKTVAWTNLAGCLIVAISLWGGERSLKSAIDLLTDPMNWVIMLGAAGVGWAIHFVVPGAVRRYLDISLEVKRRALHDKLNTLEKEWGTEVRASAPLEELAEVERGDIEAASEDGEASDDAESDDKSE